ncbi:uncharacterized protein DUF1311 [Acinetobacter calcoaceticus]|uniref:Uncharacterized protein DUF1311 n=1 Tax=Acinetobacter calcoaceticus TaxID=471 RepID=A0A4R1XIM0_ACICA|nr:uncharacterized protein DUF1311 [Acinetobacter calcoaceticus]
MKFKLLALISCTLMMTGCDKVKSLAGKDVKCDDETTKTIVVEAFNKSLSEAADERVKELVETENIALDRAKLRAVMQQITFNVTNVRTNNSDPNSKKEYCATEFVVKLPDQMVKDANAARKLYDETDVAQAAILTDISLVANELKKELEYFVQPTDDKKTVYVQLENADVLTSFVRNVAVDSLLKTARQNSIDAANQEEMKRVADENATAQAYQSVLIAEAKSNLDKANVNINLVWNATTKDVRNQLIDEQKIWLKKRELECKLNSTETDNPEVARLNCEASMTAQRTQELRQKIYYLE